MIIKGFMKFRNPPFAARGLALTDQKTKEADSIIVSLFLLWLISTRVGGAVLGGVELMWLQILGTQVSSLC